MNHDITFRFLSILAASFLFYVSVLSADIITPAQYSRMVFLGSSTTDGNTYPSLIQQALSEAKYQVPLCFNAGIGGNVTAEMAARIDRDVLAYKPTLVILQAGANDASKKLPTEEYIKTVKSIIDKLRKENIQVIALTTNIRGGKLIADETTVVEYNDALKKLAETGEFRIADAFALQNQARADGKIVVENDGLHPNYEGHRLIARAILDAMGYPGVPVPEKQIIKMYPGVITEWQMKASMDGKALDEKTVAALTVDETWVKYQLSESEKLLNWWQDGERQRGFAVSLAAKLGKAKRYFGTAYIDAEKPREVIVNTGASLQAVWVNGVRIYKNTEYRGWHAGCNRIPVTMKEGRNTLVIETTDSFFLSVTDSVDW